MSKSLSKQVLAAMRAAGLTQTQVEDIKSKLVPKPAFKLKSVMVKRIEAMIAERGTAVVTRKFVFSVGGYMSRKAGSATQLAAARAIRAAKKAQAQQAFLVGR